MALLVSVVCATRRKLLAEHRPEPLVDGRWNLGSDLTPADDDHAAHAPEQARAMVAAVDVHHQLGPGLLAGLPVQEVNKKIKQLATFPALGDVFLHDSF